MPNSRRKGADGERCVAAILRQYGYTEARRGVQYQGSPDSPDVIGLPHIHIEVKRTEALRLMDAYEQSFRDAGMDEMPVVIHKRNREPWFVTMTLENWMKLYTASEYRYEWGENNGRNE